MTKKYEVKRFKNGMGHSHLVIILEPAIADQYIGRVMIVPYAEGFKDPVMVEVLTNEDGMPLIANGRFAIVMDYIYDDEA